MVVSFSLSRRNTMPMCIHSLCQMFTEYIVFLTTVPLAPNTESDMQKVINKHLLTEFPVKGNFDDNRGIAIQASKVSELDRRPPLSGKAAVLFWLKMALWSRSGSQNRIQHQP